MNDEGYLGEIRLVAFDFAPPGWAACDGQLLVINQNVALFSIIGTTYGGDGLRHFALPDLRGRIPLHASNQLALGATGGQESHRLLATEIPPHTHPVAASASAANQTSPAGNVWADGGEPTYAAAPDAALAPQAVGTAGGDQGHENRQPFLVVNAIIALEGVFPPLG